MRIKLTVLGREIFEWSIGKEEDLSALLPLLLQEDEDGIIRVGGNDQFHTEIDEKQVDLEPYYDPDQEWEEEIPEMNFGFQRG